jgi:hypothetical protein
MADGMPVTNRDAQEAHFAELLQLLAEEEARGQFDHEPYEWTRVTRADERREKRRLLH